MYRLSLLKAALEHASGYPFYFFVQLYDTTIVFSIGHWASTESLHRWLDGRIHERFKDMLQYQIRVVSSIQLEADVGGSTSDPENEAGSGTIRPIKLKFIAPANDKRPVRALDRVLAATDTVAYFTYLVLCRYEFAETVRRMPHRDLLGTGFDRPQLVCWRPEVCEDGMEEAVVIVGAPHFDGAQAFIKSRMWDGPARFGNVVQKSTLNYYRKVPVPTLSQREFALWLDYWPPHLDKKTGKRIEYTDEDDEDAPESSKKPEKW